MPRDSESYGEPHTLTVHEVRLPDGPLDDGDLGDYDLEHPPACKEETVNAGEHSYTQWVCDVAHWEGEFGMALALRLSGTPVTGPGTYRIQGWGRKTYYHGAGYEHDAGVGVMQPEEATP